MTAHWVDRQGSRHERQGECLLTEYGIEGRRMYAIGVEPGEQIAERGDAVLTLDLAPGHRLPALARRLATARGKRRRATSARWAVHLPMELARRHRVFG